MNPPAPKEIEQAVRLIYKHSNPKTSLLLVWKNHVGALTNDTLSLEQLEYLITTSTKPSNKASEEAPSTATLALIRLFLYCAQEQHETKYEKKTQSQLEKLKAGSTDEELFEDYLLQIEQNQFRSVIIVRPNMWPLIVDQIAQWVSLWYFSTQIGGLNLSDFDHWSLVTTQVFFIPVAILTWVAWVNHQNRIQNQKLLINLGLESQVIIKYQGNSIYFLLLLSIGFLGIIINLLIESQGISVPNTLLATIVWVAYLIIYHSFSAGKLSEKSLKNQLDEQIDFTQILSIDENDEIIVTLQGKLKALISRLDAYVLESALFGALAFSGFLQIMAEELVNFNALDQFADAFFQALSATLLFATNEPLAEWSFLTEKSSIFSLIAFLTLVCSILFVAVIASRLRFSDSADRVNHHLDLAVAFNQKEEALLHQQKRGNSRLTEVNLKIHKELNTADSLLRSLQPITRYMEFFRNSGILSFFIILITSGLLISPVVSICFAALGAGTYLYFNRQSLQIRLQSARFYGQYLGVNYSNYIVLAAILLVLLATYLSVYHQFEFGLLLLVSFCFFLAYRMVFIFITPHLDNSFGREVSISPLLKKAWGIGEFLLLSGFGLMLARLPGASFFIGLGFLLLSVVYFRLSIKFSSKWLLGALSGLYMAVILIASALRVLMAPISYYFILSGAFILLLMLLLIWLRKVKLHRILINMILGISLLGLYFQFGYHHHRVALYLQAPDWSLIGDFNKQYQNLVTYEEDIDWGKVEETGENLLKYNYRNNWVNKERYARAMIFAIFVKIEHQKTGPPKPLRELLNLSTKLAPGEEGAVSLQQYQHLIKLLDSPAAENELSPSE